MFVLGIVSYMQSQIGDPAKPVVGLKALKSFLKEDDISVLGFFDSETDPRLVTFQDSCKLLIAIYWLFDF